MTAIWSIDRQTFINNAQSVKAVSYTHLTLPTMVRV